MRRLDIGEIEDQAWCPQTVRDHATEWLSFAANLSGAFVGVAPILERAMAVAGTRRILDLCSGAGGPWESLARPLSRAQNVSIELSDLYPNVDSFAVLEERSGGQISFRPEPVDATNVPGDFPGVRTMFNGFHHFNPRKAREVLRDAVAKRNPICIFEVCTHRAIGMAIVAAQIPPLVALTPFISPRSWSRLFFTYGLPLIPALVAVDGAASMLRLYSAEELHEMAAELPAYDWQIGGTAIHATPFYLRHFLGMPK